jgi:hypothetical protein
MKTINKVTKKTSNKAKVIVFTNVLTKSGKKTYSAIALTTDTEAAKKKFAFGNFVWITGSKVNFAPKVDTINAEYLKDNFALTYDDESRTLAEVNEILGSPKAKKSKKQAKNLRF